MLSGVLLIVIIIIYMMQGTVSSADSTLDAQMKSAGVALDPSYYLPGAKPQFLPNSPADGAWGTDKPNISALITVKDAALNGVKFNWNGVNSSIYDPSVVLSMSFEDLGTLGESATKAVDASSYANNGTIYGNTVLLLHMDENTSSVAYDESAFGHNGALSGATWSVGKNGAGVYTDGIDDIITASSSGFTWPHVTTEFWYKHAKSQSGTVFAYNIYGDGAPGSWLVLSGNSLYSYYLNPSAGTSSLGSTTLVPDNWYHVATSFNRATNYAAFYVNGAKIGETSSFAPYQTWSYGSPVISLGAAYHWVATAPAGNKVHDYTAGTFDEVAIHNRSLSASEVLGHYNAGRAKHANWEPAGKWNSAIMLDGINDFVNTSYSGTMTTWTLAAWIKDRGDKNNYRAIIQTYTGNDDALYVYPSTSGNVLGYWNAGGGTYAILPNTWTYVVAVRNSTNHICYFVNDAQPAGCSAPYARNIDKLQIGGYGTADNELFSGWIDEPRAWNRPLSVDEIRMQYRTNLYKYSPNVWLFEYRNESLAAGAYNYTLYTNGGYRKDSSSETRTVKVCSIPLVPC